MFRGASHANGIPAFGGAAGVREDGAPSFAASFRTAVAPVTPAPVQPAPVPEAPLPSAGAIQPGQETPSPSATTTAPGHAASFRSVTPAPAVTTGVSGTVPHGPTMPPHPVATCAPLPGRPPEPLSPSVMPPAEPLPGQALSGDVAAREMPADAAAVPDEGAAAAETGEAGSGSREKEHVAASLLEILAQPDSAINPHVRSMAMDTLQALLPEIGTPGFLRMLAGRLCLMERPPASLLRTLLAGNDREIVHTLLLDARMPESLLVEIAERSDPEVLLVLARRRRLSTAVCNALLKCDDPGIMLELLRNRNAVIEEHGYWAVVRRAREEHGLHAPLVTREDLPAAVAFDLFWHLPPMQRRFVISRFVSDSDMLERILKIVRPVAAELDAADRAMHIETMIAMICDGDTDAAARRLSRLTGLHADACGRIVSDASGEALTITFKALGLQRRVFTDVIERIRTSPASPLDGRREIEELRILFDTLSTNKSWVMLTYWDWSARGIGPYSDRDAAPGRPDGVAMPARGDATDPAGEPEQTPEAGDMPAGEPAPGRKTPETRADMPALAEDAAEEIPEASTAVDSGSQKAACGVGDAQEEGTGSDSATPVHGPEMPAPQTEASAPMEEEHPEIPEPAATGTAETADATDGARAEEATTDPEPVTEGIAVSDRPEEGTAEAEEEALPLIGHEAPEEAVVAEEPAETEAARQPEESRPPETVSAKEETDASVPEEKPESGEDGADDEEELPDDPLARIDALLRQLQKAARGGGSDRDEEEAKGKVA